MSATINIAVVTVDRELRAEFAGRGRITRAREGGKAPAKKLFRAIKVNSKRADFVRFVWVRTVTVEEVMAAMNIKRPNVAAYLVALRREHGIGYELDKGIVRLLFPQNSVEGVFSG